jgi:hypothetical protein
MKNVKFLNTKTHLLFILLGYLLCTSMGCGTSGSETPKEAKEVSEVRGKVLLPTGRPLKGGRLILRPFGGVKNATKVYADIDDDGTFTAKSDGAKQKIVASNYKVFISLSGDPKNRLLEKVVPEKYLDVREEDYETDLFINLNEQTSDIVLKMTK